ncbi:MAG: serine/threonine protein kinase [Acidobacteria bacterium]|nr:serine/threonine protein kinase [Acidobacteriota bacterium]
MTDESDGNEKRSSQSRRQTPDFEPNMFVFDVETSTPPRLIDSERVAPADPPKPAAPPRPKVAPERVAHFKIVSKIGEGGMGVVYRASDEYLQRLVALKVLGSDQGEAADTENTQRLLREARAASRISHPNVVTIYAAGEQDGVAFIAMEYVEGVELSKIVGPQGLDTERALSIASQIADGLAAAHSQGIVHRDIKPANILVCRDDKVKILDFGLAKPGRLKERYQQPSPDGSPSPESLDSLNFYNTQAGVIWGSLRYMSPEQFGGEAVDGRSDVFSLGIVLYQMLTGQLPFVAKKPREQLTALLKQTPPPLRNYRLRIPDSVQAIVDRALAKDRDLRFGTAFEMAAELRTIATRLRDFGDDEIEDVSASTRVSHSLPLPKPAPAPAPPPRVPAAPVAAPLGVRYDQRFAPDTVAYFPEGSDFDAVIISRNVYPWQPRSTRGTGAVGNGTAIGFNNDVFEVRAIDPRPDGIIRYFLAQWPAHAVLRRPFEYDAGVVRAYTGEMRVESKGISGLLTSIFGSRSRS